MKKITLLLLFLIFSVSSYSQVVMPTEGFDSTTGITGPLPATWSLGFGDWKVFENNTPATISSTKNWGINVFADGIYHSPLQSASVDRENNGAGSVSEDYLSTPAMHINDTGVNELHFWTRMGISGNQGSTFKVMWAYASNPQTDSNSYIPLQEWSELDLIVPTTNFSVWTEKTVPLPTSLNGQDIYIAFVRVHNQITGGLEGDRWFIDDVGVASQCTAPTNLAIVGGSITQNSANLTWANPSGATTWEIEVIPATGTPTGVPSYPPYTGSLPFTATGLLPNTAYKFYVRAICSSGFTSAWSSASTIFTTAVAPPVCGGNLVDSGGISGNYSSNENITTTVTPNPGDLVTVTFTAFNTQAGSDILRIYDGPNNTFPLIATLSGTTIPPSYTASSVSGALTFVFTSNGSNNNPGYVASISCNPAPPCRIPTALTVTTASITTTTAQINWTQPANPDTTVASTFDVYAVACGSPAPTAATTPTYNDISAAAGPSFVLTNLFPASCYDVYIRAVCSSNSAWIQFPVTFTTLVAPPICGGNFVDTGGLSGNYSNNQNLTTVITPSTAGEAVTVTFTAFNTQAGSDLLKVYDGDSATGTTLLATLSGTTLPPSFISSHPSGALTFVFTSNGSTVASGWVANITCAPKPVCTAPTNFTAGTATHNAVPLSWVQAANPDASAQSWELAALPCGQAPTASTTWTAAGTNPFTLGGLTPETCYDIYLRSACGSTIVGPVTITTLIAPPVCGGTFVDAGGTNGDYANSSNITTIICPNNPGDVVTVTFTSFNTEANWDGFYVYNGNTIGASNLISSGNPAGNSSGPLTTPGAFWGTTAPCPFTSSAANGCLTFVFKSDTSGTRSGWVANVTCAPPTGCAKPISITAPAATVTHNSAVINWTQPANPDTTVATAWQVLKLPCGSPAPDASTTTGWVDVTIAPPYTLQNLDPTTCYDIYVRAVCGATTSAWSCPKATITTKVAPPVCGGIFVDAGGPNANYPEATTDSTTVICPTNPGDTVTVTFTFFETEATTDGLYVFDGSSILGTATPINSTNGAGTVPGGVAGSFWGTLTGANLPGPFTSSTPDGCLTFRFRTGAFGNDGGWLANVTCAPAPNCLKPLSPVATNITSTSAMLGWTEPSTSVTSWEILVLPAGSPAPLPTTTGTIVGSNPALVTGLLPATQYTFWVRGICPAGGTSLWSTAGNFLTLIINDNCDGAVFAPVNSSAECQQSTPGTITGATASTGVPAGCIGNANDDVWFQFIASNSYLSVALQDLVGTTQNLNFGVYSGACGGTFTQVFCSTANNLTGVLNNLTVGQTYYIRVWSNAAAAQTVTFDLCITTPSTCPTGSTICSLTDYVNTTGVTSLGAIGCLSSTPNPTYFTLNVAQTGPINFLLTQSTTPGGAPDLDVDYAAWGPFTSQAAGCTAISGGQVPGIGVPISLTTGCSFSADSTEILNIANAQAGQFYIILITNYSDDPGFINLIQTNQTAPGAGQTNCCPNAYFKYLPAAFCRVPSTPNPTPIITQGSVAGTFSSSPGLVFVDSGTNTGSLTGQINIMASAPGNYLVTNTTLLSPACTQQFSQNYTINITEPTSATITYNAAGPAAWCKSDTTTHAVTQTGTPNGSYSAIPNIGLAINPATGEINPSLSSPGVYTVVYGLPGSVCTIGNPSTQVEIYPIPIIIQPANVVACETYTLPALTVGNYYSQSQLTGPGSAPLDPSVPITSNQTVYIYAINANGCTNEKSFTITINPKPVITASQVTATDATCTTPGSIAVDGFPNTGASPAPNLFISEVTDSTAGSLTYVEIYNGTGAPVNLANYKLRTFNNGSATFTTGCDNALTGTLANNAVRVIAIGSNTNAPGVTPNQTFAACNGVNWDDCIKLVNTSNAVIDVWGRTDGVAYTPLNQSGYSYKRLPTAPHPSTTWNPADWNVTDWTATTEDYSDVGHYAYLSASYEFALDTNPYIPSNTATGVLLPNVTPGVHTVTVRNVITGCISDPYSVTIGLVGATPTDSDFSYGVAPVTVCELSTTNPMPIPTNASTFTTGGTYSLVPATQTGLALNSATGEIDLSSPLTVPGTYTIIYNVGDVATCLEFNSTTVQITIAPATPAEVGFDYNNGAPICPISQATLAPQLNTGFVTNGVFAISPTTGGVSIDPSTGVLTFAANVTPGNYDVTYDLPSSNTSTNCTQTPQKLVQITIRPVINANVSFGYPASVCALAGTLSPINVDPNFTTGGTFTISPATTGVSINGSGVVTFPNTASGNFSVVYTVAQNDTTCQALTASPQIQFTITPATTPTVGFHYDSPVCAGSTANPMPILDANFVTGGAFGPSSLVDPATGEITGVLTAGQQYTITYHIDSVPASCQNANDSSAQISVSSPIEVDMTGECISNKFTLTANPVNNSFDPTQVTYEWTNSAGIAVGSQQTLVVTPTMGPGLYHVTVEQAGCSGSDSDTFNNVGCQIQKGISANGDTLNDTFDLTGFGVKQLTIFNRLGMKVYSRANYVNEWGGKSDDGDELPDGTYFYVIDTTAGKTETGWIYINRAQ